MKVVLAGAFGHLGSDCLRALVSLGHEVVAFGRTVRKPEDCSEGYRAVVADVTEPESLKGICDGADVVISTVGLTSAGKPPVIKRAPVVLFDAPILASKLKKNGKEGMMRWTQEDCSS